MSPFYIIKFKFCKKYINIEKNWVFGVGHYIRKNGSDFAFTTCGSSSGGSKGEGAGWCRERDQWLQPAPGLPGSAEVAVLGLG